jgi:hypothetical protein
VTLRPGLRAPLGLAALAVVLFADPLFRGRVLFERDISTVWQGQAESFVRTIQAGSWPLWDPWVAFGHPMLANPNMQVLYPPAWLSLVASAPACYAALAFAHVLFAGLGAAALARRMGAGEGAAFTAGAVFMASGPLLSLVNVWHHLAGASWAPWVLLAAERSITAPSWRSAVVLGVVLAAQMLAGSPDLLAMTGLVVAFWMAAAVLRRARTDGRRLAAMAALAGFVALGGSAGQWVPALAAALESDRASLPEAMRTAWAVHPWSLLETISAVPGTDLPISESVRARLYDGGRPMVHSLYLGLPALALVAAAFAGTASSTRRWWAVVLALAVLYALGTNGPVYGVLTTVAPPLRALRYPSKAMALGALAFAILAGLGFDGWRSETGRWSRRSRLAVGFPLALATLGVSAAAAIFGFRPDLLQRLLLTPDVLGSSLAAALSPAAAKLGVAAALGLVALLVAGRATRNFAAAGVAALAILDLVLAHIGLNPTAPPDFYRYRPPPLEAIRQDDLSRLFVYRYSTAVGARTPGLDVDNPYRIAAYPAGFTLDAGRSLAARLYLLPPVGAVFGVFSSYDPDLLGLYPRPLAALVRHHRESDGTAAYTRLLRLGGVSQVVALHERGLEGLEPIATYPSLLALPIRLFRVKDPLARTYMVSGIRAADDDAALRLLDDPSFDPAREIVVPPSDAAFAGGARPAGSGFRGRSRVAAFRPDRVALECEASEAGFVVLLDTFDAGWSVRVDGVDARLLRANVAFRAVAVGPGQHAIEMVYRPRPALLGIASTVLTLAAVLGALLVGQRRPGSGSPPGLTSAGREPVAAHARREHGSAAEDADDASQNSRGQS